MQGVAAAQSAARGSEPGVYDGQSELRRDGLDDIVTAVSTAAGQQAALELLEDERGFIDLERSQPVDRKEHLVVRSPRNEPPRLTLPVDPEYPFGRLGAC